MAMSSYATPRLLTAEMTVCPGDVIVLTSCPPLSLPTVARSHERERGDYLAHAQHHETGSGASPPEDQPPLELQPLCQVQSPGEYPWSPTQWQSPALPRL